MVSSHPPRFSLLSGAFVSIMFAALLSHSIMSGTLGNEISLAEFFSDFSNILYVTMMSLICLAAWVVTGQNNRTYILCWASGYVLNTLIFYFAVDYFLNVQKNIYVLNIIGLISIVPLYLFCRYRILILNFCFSFLVRFKTIRTWAGKRLNTTSVTSLTVRLDSLIIFLIIIEIGFSLLMTFWSLYYWVPITGSVGAVLYDAGHVDYFTYYYYVLDFWTILFILSLVRHIYLDVKTPDHFKTVARSLIDKKLERIRSKKSRRD